MLHNPFSVVNPYILHDTNRQWQPHPLPGSPNILNPGQHEHLEMQSLPDWDAGTWLFVRGDGRYLLCLIIMVFCIVQQWTLSSTFKLLTCVMKCVVQYDFIIKYKCIMVLGSVNPHGSWYLPFWVIGWLYLSPVFSAFKGWWRHRETACCEAGTCSC